MIPHIGIKFKMAKMPECYLFSQSAGLWYNQPLWPDKREVTAVLGHKL